MSSELAEDAVAFDMQLSRAMIAAVGAGLDGAFVTGTGAGKPLGILNSPALITVTKGSGQLASTVLLTNITDMVSRLSPASYRNSVWLVHPTTLGPSLALAAAVAGSLIARTVVQNADGSLTIMGRPVSVTDACSVLSSAGDIILADLTQYAIGMRRDVSIEMSRDAYFATDELGFKLTLRLDGQTLASAPTKLRDGTNTVSPFIASFFFTAFRSRTRPLVRSGCLAVTFKLQWPHTKSGTSAPPMERTFSPSGSTHCVIDRRNSELRCASTAWRSGYSATRSRCAMAYTSCAWIMVRDIASTTRALAAPWFCCCAVGTSARSGPTLRERSGIGWNFKESDT